MYVPQGSVNISVPDTTSQSSSDQGQYFRLVEPHWFTQQTKKNIPNRNDWPDGNYDQFSSDIFRLNTISDPSKLYELREQTEAFYTWYYGHFDFSMMFLPGPNGCDKTLAEIDKRIAKIECPEYLQIENLFEKDELVNGYRVLTTKNIFSYVAFCQFRDAYFTNPPPRSTFEEFFQWFETHSCTHWCKMDRDGNSIVEEDWDFRKLDNAKGLYELPYPLEFIKETVERGCRSLQESVAYSNLLGASMVRLLEKFPLKQ